MKGSANDVSLTVDNCPLSHILTFDFKRLLLEYILIYYIKTMFVVL